MQNNQFASNDFLNSLKFSGVPDHTLRLKVGCQCSVLKNLTRFLLPRVEFFFKLPGNTWTVYRKQFPLRLAYANTYNSAIGLTLNRAVFDLRTEVFSHGQLYTSHKLLRDVSCIIIFWISRSYLFRINKEDQEPGAGSREYEADEDSILLHLISIKEQINLIRSSCSRYESTLWSIPVSKFEVFTPL